MSDTPDVGEPLPPVDDQPIRQVDDAFIEATCPLPGCGAPLYIEWHASRAVYLADTAADLADVEGAHTSSWDIACGGGHTVLTPPDTAEDNYTFGDCHCSTDDPRVPGDCGHGDMARLRRLVNPPDDGPAATIREVIADLPQGHAEKGGLIRALELIRWGG